MSPWTACSLAAAFGQPALLGRESERDYPLSRLVAVPGSHHFFFSALAGAEAFSGFAALSDFTSTTAAVIL